MKTAAYAATAADRPLAPFAVERREPGPRDVAIDILYCGLCHSDIMQVRNELGRSRYPLVPGHEIVGRVAHVGAEVTRVKAGDIVGVGGMVDSCRECFIATRGTSSSARRAPRAHTTGPRWIERRSPTAGTRSTSS
ncbi:alcohol dehydrogenase catalytic domain-containing protein [Nannocystis pusilla]|uniref:alcohol dehydrogenase catalytic domain-containing protein n=1 Tax=Nannocystis pusilla TaxID=889268 RepID=UPI003B79393D